MDFTITGGASALAVFLQGVLSFLSPCVLPLLPLYIGYLAGGVQAGGQAVYPRKRVVCNTLFFVLGVSFAFFALGFGFTTLGRFFSGNRRVLSQVGGVLVMLFGLYQLGVFGGGVLARERRLPFRLDKLAMNPLVALLFGFTFSFAWTPCVGPALASVLVMASAASTAGAGFALIGVYTLGFTLPFLAVGLSAGALLKLLQKHRNVVKYTVKIGGVLLVLMGILMFTGVMNRVTGYLSGLGAPPAQSAQNGADSSSAAPSDADAPQNGDAQDAPPEPIPAPDFTLKDQYGTEHTLSDYKGKTVLINFWATWCGYCKDEMPDLQQFYMDHGENEGDVVVLGIAAPGAGDVSEEEISAFLDENGYTYPTLMDATGEQFAVYGASGLPTTWMVDAAGNVASYYPGMMSRAQMDALLESVQTNFSPQNDQ